jgi:mono/diheme cytochrome c family protein
MKRLILPAMFLFTSLAVSADDPGAALYRQRMCTACHAADGSGNTPAGKSLGARDLRSAEVQKKTDAELAAVISEGRGKMPSFKSSLSPEQIGQVVAYIRTLAKPDGS